MIKAYLQDYNYTYHWDTKYSTPKNATKYIKKLLRHFKIQANIYFTSYKSGHASYGSIILPKKNISLGMIAHEIGHLLAFKKGFRGHTKRAYRCIHKVYRYSIKYIPTEILLDINKRQLLLNKGVI